MFGKKKEPEVKGLVGVDIGAGGLKVVELATEKHRMRLMTYGYAELKDPGREHPPLLDDPKKGAQLLNEIMKESGMKSTRANASLPSHAVFHAIITIPQPKDAKEDIKPMIESQVKKLLPMPLDEMILDSTVIDKHLMPKKGPKVEMKTEAEKKAEVASSAEKPVEKLIVPSEKMGGSSKSVRILVSGAPKDLVGKYVEMFKMAKLELVSLETEAFALIRSMIGKDKSRIMIVDIGYERTNITIVHEGIPYLHRSIKAGGSTVTNMMAKQMGISIEEAEQAKRDLAFSGATGDLPPVLRDAMMPIMHEVKYSLELYGQQDFHANSLVDKIIVTGGSANLPQIDTFLAKNLDINVYLGDPWARVISAEGLRPVLEEIGSRFSVAIGLAMKDFDKK